MQMLLTFFGLSSKEKFFELVSLGSLADLRKAVLEEKIDVGVTNDQGDTALHLVSTVDKMEVLLAGKCDVNSANALGVTPLHAAVNRHLSPGVKRLLECGADIHAKDKDGQSVLHIVVFSKQYDSEAQRISMAKFLLNAGAASELESRNHDGRTPLDDAIRFGRNSLAPLLAKMETKDPDLSSMQNKPLPRMVLKKAVRAQSTTAVTYSTTTAPKPPGTLPATAFATTTTTTATITAPTPAPNPPATIPATTLGTPVTSLASETFTQIQPVVPTLQPLDALEIKETIALDFSKEKLNIPYPEFVASYREISKIGGGAFGQVFKGVFRGQVVAYKRVSPTAKDAAFAARSIQKEAEVLAGLDHPFVVKLIAAVTAPRVDCGLPAVVGLVLEFVDGTSLSRKLRQEPSPSLFQRLCYVVGLARAFGYLHGRNGAVVHRDIKPDNIVIRASTDTPVLVDFGLAREQNTEGHLSTDTPSAGTSHYLSPEQIFRSEIGFKVDVYAFGVLLPEVLTGVPWVLDLDQKIGKKRRDFPSFKPKRLNDRLATIGLGCTDPDSNKRPDFDQIIADLLQSV